MAVQPVVSRSVSYQTRLLTDIRVATSHYDSIKMDVEDIPLASITLAAGLVAE